MICFAVALALLPAAFALAGAAVLASPAGALVREAADTRTATSLALSAAPAVVEYGGSAVVSGDLRADGAVVAGATLAVSSSTDGLSWADVTDATTTDAGGHFSLEVTPVAAYGRTVFRVAYAGSDALQPATAQVTVGSHAALTAPPAPQTVGRDSRFAVSGLLRPRHLAGSAAVTISCYRRESGVWVPRKTVSTSLVDQADQPDASLYSATVSLPLAGKWCLRAYHADDAHAATWSAVSTIVTVTAKPDEPVWNRDGVTTLPERMASRRASRQLVVVTAARLGSRDGRLRLFDYRDGDWVETLAVTARLGRRGVIDGLLRHAGSLTTPTGIWRLPGYVFGTHPRPPSGVKMAYRRITRRSWWSSERNATYNTWVETRRYVYGEHLADYPVQYEFAVSSGYNARPNSCVIGRGSGIFVHVFGPGYTAGCVSVARGDMIRLLRWLDPAARPACAVGTLRASTRTSILAY